MLEVCHRLRLEFAFAEAKELTRANPQLLDVSHEPKAACGVDTHGWLVMFLALRQADQSWRHIGLLQRHAGHHSQRLWVHGKVRPGGILLEVMSGGIFARGGLDIAELGPVVSQKALPLWGNVRSVNKFVGCHLDHDRHIATPCADAQRRDLQAGRRVVDGQLLGTGFCLGVPPPLHQVVQENLVDGQVLFNDGFATIGRVASHDGGARVQVTRLVDVQSLEESVWHRVRQHVVADCMRQLREFANVDLDNEQLVSRLKVHPLKQAPQEVFHGANAPLRGPLRRLRAIGG